jgi:hypothetical protein
VNFTEIFLSLPVSSFLRHHLAEIGLYKMYNGKNLPNKRSQTYAFRNGIERSVRVLKSEAGRNMKKKEEN